MEQTLLLFHKDLNSQPRSLHLSFLHLETLQSLKLGKRDSDTNWQRNKMFSHFLSGMWDVGLAKAVEHHICLRNPRPFHERSHCIAPTDIDDVHCHIQELPSAGIIKESCSPYSCPIVVAWKKDTHVRMCFDYRTLNSCMIPDYYTKPRIDDALECLSGSK